MTYVTSDIHGNKDRFESILRQINLQPEDRLFILGDVIDRGEYGIEILDTIRQMPNATMLMGNHEYMMLNVLEDSNDDFWRLWCQNGNEPTISALYYKDFNYINDLIDYINDLPTEIEVTVNDEKFTLVHAAPGYLYDPVKDAQQYGDEVEFAVWYRMPINQKGIREDSTLIFGHTPTEFFQYDYPMTIFRTGNIIDIDCGCGYEDGRLACLRLDDMQVFYSTDESNEE